MQMQLEVSFPQYGKFDFTKNYYKNVLFCFLGLMNLLLVENQSAQEFRVKGGSQRISQKLVSKIGPHRVLLKHAANKIEQTVVLIWDQKLPSN